MGLLDTIRNFRSKQTDLGTPRSTWSFVQSWFTGEDEDSRSSSDLLSEYRGYVFACVRMLAMETAKHPAQVFRETGSGKNVKLVEADDHPFAEIIRNPSDKITEYEFTLASESFFELVGDYFIYFPLYDNSRKPAGMRVVRPDMVDIVVDPNDLSRIGYQLRRANGETVLFDDYEMAIDRAFNPLNEYRGLGTLRAALLYVDTERSAARFTKNYLKNSGLPSGVISLKGKNGSTVSQEAFQLFKEQWTNQYTGGENAGKVAVLRDSDADFTRIGLGLDNVDLKILRQMTKDDIYTIFGVPQQYDQRLTYSNAVQFRSTFLENQIEPRLHRRARLYTALAERFYPRDRIVVKYPNIIPEDREYKLDYWKQAVDLWATPNEARAAFDMDAAEWGDKIRRPINQMPVDAQKSVTKLISKSASEAEIVAKHEQDDYQRKETYRSGLEHIQTSYEEKMSDTMTKYLEQQKRDVLGTITPKSREVKKNLFGQDEEIRRLVAAMQPIALKLAEDSGEFVMEFISAGVAFELTKEIRDYINSSVRKFATAFTEETIEKLSQELAEGYLAGESTAKIAKRITGIYDDAMGYRSKRVSRTETLRYSNESTLWSFEQAGIEQKEWFTNPTACELCRPFKGARLTIRQDFLRVGESYLDADGKEHTNSYENVSHPPLHPNCQCRLLPYKQDNRFGNP